MTNLIKIVVPQHIQSIAKTETEEKLCNEIRRLRRSTPSQQVDGFPMDGISALAECRAFFECEKNW